MLSLNITMVNCPFSKSTDLFTKKQRTNMLSEEIKPQIQLKLHLRQVNIDAAAIRAPQRKRRIGWSRNNVIGYSICFATRKLCPEAFREWYLTSLRWPLEMLYRSQIAHKWSQRRKSTQDELRWACRATHMRVTYDTCIAEWKHWVVGTQKLVKMYQNSPQAE